MNISLTNQASKQTLSPTPNKQITFLNNNLIFNSETNDPNMVEISFDYLMIYNGLVILLFLIMLIYIKCLRRKNYELSNIVNKYELLPFHQSPSPGSNSPRGFFFSHKKIN